MIKYKGLKIITSRGIYEPAEDSFLAAEVLELQLGMFPIGELSVLDMGTGTGILGLVAATSPKVKRVLFADINQKAVAQAMENIAFNAGVIKAECAALHSDLFSNIDGNFDMIIFNAPYLKDEKGEDKSDGMVKAWTGGKEGIEESLRFLQQASNHLNKNGRILLVASSLSNLAKLRSEYRRMGYKEKSEKKTHIFFEDIIAITLAKN